LILLRFLFHLCAPQIRRLTIICGNLIGKLDVLRSLPHFVRINELGTGRMKKILTLGFLLLGLQQLSAQPLPLYDLSYYDSPKCIKEKANSFAKNTLTTNKPDEAVGKSICEVAKAAMWSSRQDMAKRWDKIPSEVRWKCINTLDNDRKAGRIPMIDYGMLDTCINDLMKK
jgi:hypothetical protein